jgi:hypothetical protein
MRIRILVVTLIRILASIFHTFWLVICKLMRIRIQIQLITLMRIRIQLITLMRIRIQLITLKRIGSYRTFQFDADPVRNTVSDSVADPDPGSGANSWSNDLYLFCACTVGRYLFKNGSKNR